MYETAIQLSVTMEQLFNGHKLGTFYARSCSLAYKKNSNIPGVSDFTFPNEIQAYGVEVHWSPMHKPGVRAIERARQSERAREKRRTGGPECESCMMFKRERKYSASVITASLLGSGRSHWVRGRIYNLSGHQSCRCHHSYYTFALFSSIHFVVKLVGSPFWGQTT